jgi:hypothetical protein
LDAGKGAATLGLGMFKVNGIGGAGEPLVLAGEPLFDADSGGRVPPGEEGAAPEPMVGEVTSSLHSFYYDALLLLCHVDGWTDRATGAPPPTRLQIEDNGVRYDLEWLPTPPLPREKRFGRV